MIYDGLWDPYSNVHMGTCGDKCAAEYKFTREAQDDFSKESFRRALAAQKEGMFDAEIEPVSVPQKKGDPLLVKHDEGPAKGDPASSPRSSRRSPRTAPSPRPTPRASTTARARSSSRARRPSRSTSSSRSAASSATAARPAPRVVHDRAGQGHRRHRREARPEEGPDRSLRDQRGLRGRDHGRAASSRASTRRRSTSAAARSPSGTPSAPPARACSPPSCTR